MKELYKALAGLQQEIPPIFKGTTGYGYKYADWGQILEIVNKYTSIYKLGFTQLIDGTNLKTIIFHTETGESIESIAAIPQNVQLKGMNDFQVLGSAITYMRRYALSAALGLVTDEDADASGEQIKPVAPIEKGRYIPSTTKSATDFQRSTMANLLRQRGIEGVDAILDFLQDEHGVVVKDGIAQLNEADAQIIIESIDTKSK